MEDIFYDILKEDFGDSTGVSKLVAIRLIKEVESFVDDQKNIACNNCKGKKLKEMKEPWQVR